MYYIRIIGLVLGLAILETSCAARFANATRGRTDGGASDPAKTDPGPTTPPAKK
jgi:hypothetical protein